MITKYQQEHARLVELFRNSTATAQNALGRYKSDPTSANYERLVSTIEALRPGRFTNVYQED